VVSKTISSKFFATTILTGALLSTGISSDFLAITNFPFLKS